MKKIALWIICLITCASVCAEPGVSLELSRQRAATISKVSYDLSFTIPSTLAQPVTGNVTITFAYSGKGDVTLDFTGHLLPSCLVNGKAGKGVSHTDEHITVPAKLLRRGSNTLTFSFESSNASLNRHDDYMYTLFVPANARSCFPCFDQPDLKARFSLKLQCPEGWTSANSAGSKPIPTYLFSFVCGKFQRQTAVRDGRSLTALYRETDSAKVAQLGKVFDEAAHSIRWMEEFTGIPYPFDNYGFVVLPGYQFGGMEHPGAIQFTDREIFLGQNPTPDEELTRLELIAHETAHMWFGDLVTMRWFDDVWTKEVFANFLANKVSREVYPDINHDLNFLKSYQVPALTVDRTDGTHPIQQPLANLRDAGLLYGNIIYDKAPVMMRMLSLIDAENKDWFRDGLRAYLRKYSYANATWDDLVGILDSVAPKARLKEFSNVWVKQKAMPVIEYGYKDGALVIRQTDPYSRAIFWPQRFCMAIVDGDNIICKEVVMDKAEVRVPLATKPQCVYPNADGKGYGRFVISESDMDDNLDIVANLKAPGSMTGQQAGTSVYSALLNIHENYLMGRLSGERYFDTLAAALSHCDNPLVASTITSCMATVRHYATDTLRHSYERQTLAFAKNHTMRSTRQQLLRSLSQTATDTAVVDTLYNMWLHQSDTTIVERGLLTTRDFTRMAWHLAIALPGKASGILAVQRTMLKTDDERREFDYVSRACTADTAMQRQLFLGLIPKEGRSVEPWARQMLSLLCSREREPQCNTYIQPGLDNLLMIQQSSDIFFPGYWLTSLLRDQHSEEAHKTVTEWIATHPDYPEALMNKVKQAADIKQPHP